MTENAEKFEFQAEAKQILDLMIYSVYSNKDIFMRELISNASDALDKLRFQALTNPEYAKFAEDLHIRIEIDKNNRTLSVIDNGIGMNREDLIQFLGTIAKSGTKEYLNLLRTADKAQIPELIGQFGVGFYSCLMVADEITVITRKAGEDTAWQFKTGSAGNYTIEKSEREVPGTTVALELKDPKPDDGLHDYTLDWKVQEIVKKYSDFVTYPIKMQLEKTEYETDAEGKPNYEKPKTVVKDEILNSMKAIWTRPEDEVTEEEYAEFYKHISHDWNPPLKQILYKAEGTSEFRALLFIPYKMPPAYMFYNMEHGLDLYVKRIFIMNNCENLIPKYLNFLRGVVDSEDLPLNISREILQKNRLIKVINKGIVKKVLRTFKDMLKNEKDEYLKFWHEFGKIIKEGIYQDFENQVAILEVSLFESSNSPSELTTLDDYISRMKENQEVIYYLTGENRLSIENSPHLEAIEEKGFEILYLTDVVDEVWVQQVQEFKGKRFQSISKGEVNLETLEEKEKIEENQKKYKSLLEFIKSTLKSTVKEVRLSNRLKSSPACLVNEQEDLSPNLEKLLKSTGQDIPEALRILELNPNHQIILKMFDIFEKNPSDLRLPRYFEVLYAQALLAEGSQLKSPSEFSKKLSNLLFDALQ